MVQHNEISAHDVEARQMLTGVLGIENVFIHNIGLSQETTIGQQSICTDAKQARSTTRTSTRHNTHKHTHTHSLTHTHTHTHARTHSHTHTRIHTHTHTHPKAYIHDAPFPLCLILCLHESVEWAQTCQRCRTSPLQ